MVRKTAPERKGSKRALRERGSVGLTLKKETMSSRKTELSRCAMNTATKRLREQLKKKKNHAAESPANKRSGGKVQRQLAGLKRGTASIRERKSSS